MPQSDPIDFWFSIGSMFTFLTVMRIDRVEDMTDIRFVWRPFSVRAIMIEMDNRPGAKPKKLAYAVARPAPARRDVRLRVRGRSALPAEELRSRQPRRDRRRARRLVRGLCARDLPALVRRASGMRLRAEPVRQPARDRRGPAPRDRAGAVRGDRARLRACDRRGAAPRHFRRAELRGARRGVLGRRPAGRRRHLARSAARSARRARRESLPINRLAPISHKNDYKEQNHGNDPGTRTTDQGAAARHDRSAHPFGSVDRAARPRSYRAAEGSRPTPAWPRWSPRTTTIRASRPRS